MSIRILIAGLVGAAIIIGGVMLFENSSAPVSGERVTQEGVPAVPDSASVKEEPRRVPAGWQRYENASLRFTVDYPSAWTYRTENETISFSPLARATQEVEAHPRITLTLVPLVNILGAHASAAAWFDTEVLQNAERWDEHVDTQDDNPRYSFTEGMGEYPHENIIVVREATAYWFSIEASDPAVHAVLPQIAASLKFK